MLIPNQVEAEMMKKIFPLWFFLFLFFCNSAWGLTGLGLGIRGGMLQNYKNDNLDTILAMDQDWLKEMPMVGVHLKIGTLRVLHFEVSAEYAWKKKEIRLALDEDTVKTDFSIRHISLNGSAKYIFSVPVVKPYIGGGVGIHNLVYEISYKDYSLPVPDQSKMGFHALGGVFISTPAFPLEFLVEARYTSIQTENEPTRYTTILAGLTFKFP
jgi:opacity protein-like surface antigen